MKKDYTKILELQNELSKKVITHDDLINNNISNVCGIDVSYKDLNAFVLL
jgi:deoxyinosine 3'endonuclease (endonuclease V)